MYKSFIIVGIMFVGACINPYKEFEEVPDQLEDPSLRLHLHQYNDTIALDASGYDNHATISEYIAIQNNHGNSGSFLECNGKGNISVPNLNLASFESLTFSIWLKSYAGNFEEIIKQGPDDTDINRVIIGNDKISWGDRSYDSDKLYNRSFLNGKWNMLTIVSPNINTGALQSGVKIYVNGNLEEVTNSSFLTFAENEPTFFLISYNGLADNIRCYNRVLNQTDIEALYQSEVGELTNENLGLVLSDNLINYYTFDENTFTDLMGNSEVISSQAVTYSNDTKTSSGHSLDFNNGFLSTNPSYLDKINALSISFWIKATESNLQPLFSQGNDVNNNNGLTIEAGKIFFGSRSQNFDYDLRNQALDNSWHMLTLTCGKINQSSKTEDMYLYLDGNLINQSDSSDIDFAKNLPLLIGSNGKNNFFKGLLDNIRIYNKKLSESEVNSIYQSEEL